MTQFENRTSQLPACAWTSLHTKVDSANPSAAESNWLVQSVLCRADSDT